MSGLFATLGSTATALNAQSAAINVVGNNIANVNNPNYSRETAVVEDLGSVPTPNGSQSTGIAVAVTQSRDALLDQMVRQEASLTSGFTSQQTLLQDAQAALGENISNSAGGSTSTSSLTTTNSGLSAALDQFFNAFQSLAANPSDVGQSQSLIQQAGVLTDRFQQADQNLSQVQANADAQVQSGVSSANGLLSQIAQLNTQIESLEVGKPGSAVDLRDQREAALEKLAGMVPVTATENGQGEIAVTTTDGTGHPISLVTQGTVSNGLAYAGGALQAGTTPLGVASGSLQGTIIASTGPIQSLRDSLDALAQQLVTAVNGAYNPGNTAGGNFFAAAGTTAGTISLDPSLTPATVKAGTGAAGDNSIAIAVANLANRKFSSGAGDTISGTVSQYYAGVVSGLGQALDTANTQVADQQAVQTIVTNQRSSASGVSVNEEMANLMTYQRAFQASSEVMQVVSGLLSTLMQSIG